MQSLREEIELLENGDPARFAGGPPSGETRVATCGQQQTEMAAPVRLVSSIYDDMSGEEDDSPAAKRRSRRAAVRRHTCRHLRTATDGGGGAGPPGVIQVVAICSRLWPSVWYNGATNQQIYKLLEAKKGSNRAGGDTRPRPRRARQHHP